jgi:hypothetical protein
MQKKISLLLAVFLLFLWLPASAQESQGASTSASSPSTEPQSSTQESPTQDIPQSLREISQQLRNIADASETELQEQQQLFSEAQTDQQHLDFSLTNSTLLLQRLKMEYEQEIAAIKAGYELQIQNLKKVARNKDIELWAWRAGFLVAGGLAFYFAIR